MNKTEIALELTKTLIGKDFLGYDNRSDESPEEYSQECAKSAAAMFNVLMNALKVD